MSKKVMLIDDATGESISLANGTDGYVLTYEGDTSEPVWAAGGGGGSSGYDLLGQTVGNPATNEVLARYRAARAFTISDDETKHNFTCVTRPASGSVVLTVYKTAIASGTKSAVFTATFAFDSTQGNDNYYVAAIGTVANNSVAAGDLVTVECGTTQAAFDTVVWAVYGTA